MRLFEMFILAVGLSMDAFAVSIAKGLSLTKVTKAHMLTAGLWFGGFQALMPLLGYFLGHFFSDVVAKYDHWLAFILLIFIGGKMLKESFEHTESMNSSMAVGTMLLLAIATSIDAFAVGMTFAFLKVALLPAISFIGCITFISSAIGIKIGNIFGIKYKAKAEIIGGMILIFIGIKILLDGLGLHL